MAIFTKEFILHEKYVSKYAKYLDNYDDKMKDKEDDGKEWLQELQENSARLLHMVHNLADLSSIGLEKYETKNEVFRMEELLSSVEEHALDILKNSTIQFESMKQFQTESMIGDREVIEEVLLHFILNSKENAEAGSKILMKVDELDSDSENHIKIQFAIVDQGRGISQQDYYHWMELFRTRNGWEMQSDTKTGLDLMICNCFVSNMGSELKIDMEEDATTTFSFILNLEKPSKEEL